jgi:hypothetical protein
MQFPFSAPFLGEKGKKLALPVDYLKEGVGCRVKVVGIEPCSCWLSVPAFDK